MLRARVRVFVATSLDGFIAGPGDDLSWLPPNEPDPPADGPPASPATPADPDAGRALGFGEFFEDVGALLMGRRTYDVVAGFDGPWPYLDRPVLVATHRPVEAPVVPTVRPVAGDIRALVEEAREAAGGRDVYVDGGLLIGQALDAGLVDDLILTVIPTVLGGGHPLFAGVTRRHALRLVGHHTFGQGMVQLHLQRPNGT